MGDNPFDGAEASEPNGLERRLRALSPGPPPEDLLSRCLATVPGSDWVAPARGERSLRWGAKAAALAAAVLLVGVAVGLALRPRPADAASLLRAVRTAWSEVPASHRVLRIRGPQGTRTEESWFVRGKGRRTEVRSAGELIGVVVKNRRWEFRWDVREHLVAAWSVELVDALPRPEDSGLLLDSDEFFRWAEAHRAEVRVEPATLASREAKKVVVRWPGPEGKAVSTQRETVWFDPDSLRPLKYQVARQDGQSIETTIDYPAPEAVADDLFTFRPPRDVVIEINDPDLGRQVYSERQTSAVNPVTNRPEGGAR